jgi:hypothetical protein
MEDYFYYLPGEKPEKTPAYVDIGDFRIWGVWIKEERMLQYLTDRTIARKKAKKKNSQTVYSLLRRASSDPAPTGKQLFPGLRPDRSLHCPQQRLLRRLALKSEYKKQKT